MLIQTTRSGFQILAATTTDLLLKGSTAKYVSPYQPRYRTGLQQFFFDRKCDDIMCNNFVAGYRRGHKTYLVRHPCILNTQHARRLPVEP